MKLSNSMIYCIWIIVCLFGLVFFISLIQFISHSEIGNLILSLLFFNICLRNITKFFQIITWIIDRSLLMSWYVARHTPFYFNHLIASIAIWSIFVSKKILEQKQIINFLWIIVYIDIKFHKAYVFWVWHFCGIIKLFIK